MYTYKLAYDNLFLPKQLHEGINYKNENIIELGIYMVYTALDKNNKEVNFKKPDKAGEDFQYARNFQYAKGKFCAIDNFYTCVVDPEKGYKMILNEKLQKESDYTITYEIEDCIKCTHIATPVLISYEEFMDILMNNMSSFDNDENRPTQSCSYSVVKVS